MDTTRTSLAGARVAITGKLASMTQRRAFDVVRSAGGETCSAVSRRTNLLVVGMYGWPLLPDGKISRKLTRAETLNAGGARIRIISESAFLELAGLQRRPRESTKSYSAAQVAESFGLSLDTLHRWEQFDLLRPVDGRYDFQDLVSLRAIADLIAGGVRPETISRSLKRLASVLPGTERPLAQLKVIAEDPRTILAEMGDGLMAPDGQLMLDFRGARTSAEGTEPAAQPAPFTVPRTDTAVPDDAAAEQWLEQAQRLDARQEYAAAAECYAQVVGRCPDDADARFNYGNVLRDLGRLTEAIDQYQAATRLDGTLACAWYNLADIHDERGGADDCIRCLHRALDADARYADAHYNLAMCYEQAGRFGDADRHWRAYLELDADSEWSAIARNHLTLHRHQQQSHGYSPSG